METFILRTGREGPAGEWRYSYSFSLKNLTFIRPCIASIFLKYNQQDATFSRSIYFHKLLYMFQAVPPPIIRGTKLYIRRQVLSNQYCCYRGWDEISSISSTIAAGSSIGLTIPDAVCTVLCSWWWAEEPPETCRAIYGNKQIEKTLHLVGCTLEIYFFFNLGVGWRWVVNATPRPLYPGEWPGTHCGSAIRPIWTSSENLAYHRDSIPGPSSM